MSLDVWGIEQFSWWREHCLLCGSTNHIFVDNLSVDGWECWNCKSRWWIDELSAAAYSSVHGKTEQEAEDDLKNAEGPITILSGQAQR